MAIARAAICSSERVRLPPEATGLKLAAVKLSERSFVPDRDNPLHTAQQRARRGPGPIFDLTLSNPTRSGLSYSAYQDPAHGQSTALSALSVLGQWSPSPAGGLPSPRYEPNATGLASARRAISEHWHEPTAKPDPEHLVLWPSSSEAYHALFTLLCDPGDEVLAPEPSYPLFAHLAQFSSVRLVPYRLEYDGAWHIDFSSLEAGVSPRTRAVLTVSPNNPTGSYTSLRDLQKLAELGLPIISDEVFARYPLETSTSSLRSSHGATETLTFCIDGLSKSAGLPHVKLSWLAVSGPSAERDESLRRLSWLADTTLSTATPIQQALPTLLEQSATFREGLVLRLRANLSTLQDTLANSAATVLRTEGGWYAIVRLPALATDEQWAARFLKHSNVLLHPGYYYDLEGPPHCVLSLLVPQDEFRQGATALRLEIDRFVDE